MILAPSFSSVIVISPAWLAGRQGDTADVGWSEAFELRLNDVMVARATADNGDQTPILEDLELQIDASWCVVLW